ncbi:MAG: class I SAM-dependent methyltransferase [Phycisphaerales bacterium]
MDPDARNGWRLLTHDGVVELRAPGDAPGRGLRADWSQWRVPGGFQSLRGQPLGRAVGSAARSVIDATAGLGVDAFAMAACGAQVLAVERDAWIVALLRQAHAWAVADPNLAEVAARIRIHPGDAAEVLAAHEPVDVVLLDPMFPAKRKPSAKPPKAMQALAALVGDGRDGCELLPLALRAARQRVVVKRPVHAPPLGGLTPDWSMHGKVLRFDVYRGQATA